ncbi:hypothetical protein HDV01_005782 [Terramyces sp. JEL0728]|nr:hypothetical protein HDV01_005782 [Terramyces sp. JEL0728]
MDYAVQRLTTDVSRTFKSTHIRSKIDFTVALIDATYSNISMSELFKAIGPRLRHDKWIVVFKSLSLIHLLTREGNSERILGYLCANVDILYQSFFRTQSMEIAKYLKDYSDYLKEKAGVFRQLKTDWVKDKDEAVVKFRTMDDARELLKQVEILQKQIDAVVECSWEVHSDTDLVIRQGYRFILAEMISLFHLYNEAIVRVLGLYFEMEKTDATKALECYKKFAIQSKKMNDIFSNAKSHRSYLMMDIPTFKSPPVSLVNTLEEYLYAPDFEEQRIMYKQKKNQRGNSPQRLDPSPQRKPEVKTTTKQPEKERQLIDFFDTVQDEMSNYNRAQSPTIPEFNSLWDISDGFSKEADSVQKQIQATSNLLSSTAAPIVPSVYNNVQFPPGYGQSIQQTGFGQNAFQPTNPFASMASPSTMPATMNFNQQMMPQMTGQQMFPQMAGAGFGQPKPALQEFTVESAFGNMQNVPIGNQNKDVNLDPFIGLRQNTIKPQFTGISQVSSNNPFMASANVGAQNRNPFVTQPNAGFQTNAFDGQSMIGNTSTLNPMGMQNTGLVNNLGMQNPRFGNQSAAPFGMQNTGFGIQSNQMGASSGLGLHNTMGIVNQNTAGLGNQYTGQGFQNSGIAPNQGSVMSGFHVMNDESANKPNYSAISLGMNPLNQPFAPQSTSKSPMVSVNTVGSQPFNPQSGMNTGQKPNQTPNNFNPFMS